MVLNVLTFRPAAADSDGTRLRHKEIQISASSSAISMP